MIYSVLGFNKKNCKLTFNILTILCLLDTFKNTELIKLTSKQELHLNKKLEKIQPLFQLSTYLIDPLNPNLCYIFIHNTLTNNMEHFDINLNNEQTIDNLVLEIISSNLSINFTFDLCFCNSVNINNEIIVLKKLESIYCIEKYNKILKEIIFNFFLLIYKIDKNFFLEYNFLHNSETLSSKTTTCIFYNLEIILCFGIQLKKSKKFILIQDDDLNIKILETYIIEKLNKMKNLEKFSIEQKLIQINILANNSHLFCKRYEVNNNIIRFYILNKIRLMKNKLNKFTLVLCFFKIFSDDVICQSRIKMLKLMIFLFIYEKNHKFLINDKTTMILLFKIIKKCKYDILNNCVIIESCFLENVSNISMKLLLIKRFIFFIFTLSNVFYKEILNLELSPHYTKFIWTIVKCNTTTIYNIFNIDF